MNTLLILTALIPILSVLTLLVIFKIPAKKSMPISLLITALVSYFLWEMPKVYITASIIEGIIIAASILWIVFGALLLIKILKHTRTLDKIKNELTKITDDKRIQIILITFLFGAFIEGIAGFGTPAAICAPLLIAVGFTPMSAVAISLIANSVSVTFGAVGTPVLVGITKGLKGFAGANFVQNSVVTALTMDLFVGSLIPLILVLIYSRFFSKEKNFKYGAKVWKFAIFSGFAYMIPAYLTARFLGPEFPSIIGGFSGLIICGFMAYNDILLPEKTGIHKYKYNKKELIKAWTPYFILIFFLLITRTIPPLKNWLLDHELTYKNILDTDINASINFLYLPGTFFIIVGIITIIMHKMKAKEIIDVSKKTLFSLKTASIVLISAVSLVRIFINSNHNLTGLMSMPEELAILLTNKLGNFYAIISPFIGALGSFLAGSATFSNMMFSSLQFNSATEIGLNQEAVIATQMLGANAGNMICISNIVAVSTVVNLKDKEGEIISHTIAPMLIYCLGVGLISFFFF